MSILNEEYIYVQRNELLSSILFYLVFIFIVLSIILMAERYVKVGLSFCLIAFIGIIFGIYFSHKVKTDTKLYEVVLDDNYPISAIYDNYEIIEKRGKIWVLQDKETK